MTVSAVDFIKKILLEMHMGNVSEFYKQTGSIIKSHRIKKKLTQEHLAKVLHVTRPSITNLEAGRQRPPFHFISMLCDKLDITLNDIRPAPSSKKEQKKQVRSANRATEVSQELYSIIESLKEEKL